MDDQNDPRTSAIVLDGTSFHPPQNGSHSTTQPDSAEVVFKSSHSEVNGNNAQTSETKPDGNVMGHSQLGRSLTRRREIFYQNMGFGRRLLRPNLLLCNLVLAGALLGFFIWNFVVLTAQFVNEQNDPPVRNCFFLKKPNLTCFENPQVKSTVFVKGTGEPYLPSLTLCNSIPNTPLALVQGGYIAGGRDVQWCYDGDAPILDGTCTNSRFPNRQFNYDFGFYEELELDDYNPDTPPVLGTSVTHCIAINMSSFLGYARNNRTKRPTKKNSVILLIDLNPYEINDPSFTFTWGLDGYLFANQESMPTQKKGEILNTTAGLSKASDTMYASAGLLSIITLGYSELVNIVNDNITTSSYSPSSFVTKIHPNFFNLVYNNSISADRLAVVVIEFRNPRTETYEFSATSFSSAFGAVSGWAGSLLGWDCLGIMFLVEKAALLFAGQKKVVDWADDIL